MGTPCLSRRATLALRSAVLLVGGCVVFDSFAQDVVRCRSGRLVNVGMTAAEVLARCGEPKNRIVEDVPVRAQGARGGATVVIGSTKHERWTIDRGQGQFDAVLSFEGDKLVRIELLNVR